MCGARQWTCPSANVPQNPPRIVIKKKFNCNNNKDKEPNTFGKAKRKKPECNHGRQSCQVHQASDIYGGLLHQGTPWNDHRHLPCHKHHYHRLPEHNYPMLNVFLIVVVIVAILSSSLSSSFHHSLDFPVSQYHDCFCMALKMVGRKRRK